MGEVFMGFGGWVRRFGRVMIFIFFVEGGF
jgi:hypothetical protein